MFLYTFKILFRPLDENYEVGAKEEIMLEIKPKCWTGILLSSFNPKAGDFITLEIVRGNVS